MEVDLLIKSLTRGGAKIVHPDKAFVLRDIPACETHYKSQVYVDNLEKANECLTDYILRLNVAADVLFGPVDFELHTVRCYPEGKLAFHCDWNDEDQFFEYDEEEELGEWIEDEDQKLLRGVTFVHNIGEDHRKLTFVKDLGRNGEDRFDLTIPKSCILAVGDALSFDYVHGFDYHEEAKKYRSIVTRFSKWEK